MTKYTRNIKELPAYKRLEKQFNKKGYTKGIGQWKSRSVAVGTAGYYIKELEHRNVGIEDVPGNLLREVLLYSASGCYKAVYDYIEQHLDQFDRQFWKDATSADYYNILFKDHNIFDIMPDEYLDEEMAMCAMFAAIDMRYCERRHECEGWFYTVHRRKPEILTQEMYILGARCFAEKNCGENEFLAVTPEEYRTPEYWLALCLCNDTPVMTDVPAEMLTEDFLMGIFLSDTQTIRGFTEEALERDVVFRGETVKMWQAAILYSGYAIRDISLNEERIAFFRSKYDKDSSEYEYAFKDHYKAYLRKQKGIPTPGESSNLLASMLTLGITMGGGDINRAIDEASEASRSMTKNQTSLPIHLEGRVPNEYCKKYDKEEYLLEIYKKLGIQVIEELNYFYYSVELPDTLTIVDDEYGRCVKEGDKILLHFCDIGPFYDRSVYVDEINVTI
ncbi:MAG: hypothetical protein K6F57_01625 [Candidatus Saccharibacteria bacterium]|nr:hypothetical protein [Candidatus Saccharibacteria bacterium]